MGSNKNKLIVVNNYCANFHIMNKLKKNKSAYAKMQNCLMLNFCCLERKSFYNYEDFLKE